jgi:hypothetical protein
LIDAATAVVDRQIVIMQMIFMHDATTLGNDTMIICSDAMTIPPSKDKLFFVRAYSLAEGKKVPRYVIKRKLVPLWTS